jgi:hypothetical protein
MARSSVGGMSASTVITALVPWRGWHPTHSVVVGSASALPSQGVLKGLQTHFTGTILGKDKCARIAEIGVQLGRIDGQGQSAQMICDQVGELTDVGIKAYVLGDSAAQVAALPKHIYGFEYLNEPDGRIHPDDYMAGLRDVALECDLHRIDSYGPTVSNLIRTKVLATGAELRGIEYIEACAPFPVTMKGSVHRYGDNDIVSNPHRGFVSREHEVIAMHLALDYGRPWGVSETGWASAGTLSEEGAAHNIAWDMKFWERMMALFMVLYQIHDGEGDDNISNFGLFRVDGSLKESWAKAFAA